MLTRIITGLVGIPVVVALVFWPGGMPFGALVAIVAVLGLLEFYGSARRYGSRPIIILGLLAGLLILFFGWEHRLNYFATVPSYYLIPTFTGLILIALIYEVIRGSRAPLANVGVLLLGVAYVPWLMLHFLWLRTAGEMVQVGSRQMSQGAWLVMFVLLATWALDTGAYFIGKFYGKKKLAPSLSPGKTWEGAIGGFVLATLVAAVTAAVIHMPQPHGLILGALIGVFGQIGDLAESAMKREIGIKDFGSLVPGHGGILDRLDSLLFAGPITYWYIVTFLSGWISA